MVSDWANKLAAAALAVGCIMGPSVAHGQAEPAEPNGAAVVEQENATPDSASAAAPVEADISNDPGTNDVSPGDAGSIDAAGQEAAAVEAQASQEEVAARIETAFEKEFPGIVLDSVQPTPF